MGTWDRAAAVLLGAVLVLAIAAVTWASWWLALHAAAQATP
jgi:hypothetical protein